MTNNLNETMFLPREVKCAVQLITEDESMFQDGETRKSIY